MPQHQEVIIQKQAGGDNGFSPLFGVESGGIYIAASKSSGDCMHEDWSADDACFGSEAAWEKFKSKHPRVCVLVPISG